MKNNAKKTNKKVKTIICGATILGVIGVSGIFAYLTDTDTANNKFTIGEVKIELKETDWNNGEETEDVPEQAKDIVSNQEIKKNPTITNTGKNSAYVFLKVQIPKANVVTVNDDGTKKEDGETPIELFTYEVDGTNWKEIESVRDTTSSEDYNTHVYYYKDKLEPAGDSEGVEGESKTQPLFNKVKLVNLTEDHGLTDVNLDIKIDAYAIQSENLPAGKSIEEAYTIYINQNPDVKE